MQLLKIASALEEMSQTLKGEFNRLDGRQGDGDLGVTAELVTKAMRQAATETGDIQSWLSKGATLVRMQAPSTMGVLLSFALSAAGKSLVNNDPASPQIWVDAQLAMIEEIKKRGGAKLGDRTLLDAFIPAAQAFGQQIEAGNKAQQAMHAAAKAARDGAEATRNLVPKTGRASWVGERAVGEIDGGAWFCYKVYETLAQVIG